MSLRNTTLDDLAAVVGFTATLRISAWYANTNLWVPQKLDAEHPLAKLIGESAAKRLSQEWGGSFLSVPRLKNYEDDERRRIIARMLESGISTNEIAAFVRLGERRVQMICRELEVEGLLEPVGPAKSSQKNTG
jgi:hypothetical protein